MRIVYVCSDFGIAPRGTKGASIHLRAITRALCDLGHEVLLLSPKPAPEGDHPVRELLPDGPGKTGHDRPLAERAGRIVKHWLLDRGLNSAIGAELRPLIYNAQASEPACDALVSDPPDAILERLSLFGHLGIDLAERWNVPLVLEVNAPLVSEQHRYRSLELATLARQIEERVFEKASAVLAVSQPLTDRLAAAGVARRKLHVVPNGVDVSHFDTAAPRAACRERLGFDGEFVVGFVGSLKEWHGVDVLLPAFARLQRRNGDARLLIVGTGPQELRLRQLAAQLHVEPAVRFTGAVPHDHIPELLGAMDVAVAPFHRMDDFYFSPIKLFEYMASGTCVVASRLGQVAEVITDGVNGLLCAPDDERDLLAKLEQAREKPERRRELGSRARETVRTSYTWSHTAKQVAQVIEDTVNERRPVRAHTRRGGPDGQARARSGGEVPMTIRVNRERKSRGTKKVRKEEAAPKGALRIGYLVRMYPRFSQTFIINEICELERQGLDVRILSIRLPNEGRFHESVCRVRARASYMPAAPDGSLRKRAKKQWPFLRRNPRTFWRCVKTVRRDEHAEGYDLGRAIHLLRWARQTSVRHVHVHFGSSEATVALLAHWLGGLSYSLTLHAFDIFRDNVDRVLLAHKINASRFTVTVSEFNRRFLVDNLPGVDPGKIRVNYNGVDLERFRPTNGSPPVRGPQTGRCDRTVFSLGRLKEKKGFIHLVGAIRHLRDEGLGVSCRIGGEGPDAAPLRDAIESWGLQSRVQLTGELNEDAVREHMQHCGCFVLPCVQAKDGNVDALPTVLLEAMACGAPVVSTRLSGVPEIVEDGVSGLLVEPGDDQALAGAIRRILTDPELASSLARSGRRRAEKRFSARRNVAVMRNWFGEAVSRSSRRSPRPTATSKNVEGTVTESVESGRPEKPQAAPVTGET